ncbi:MAG: hypothetical protein AB201_00205 [Parcubacteria bacterium C7867-006]|nr:MAG: hypothetical protein AB201_00205 [Parcubacteria bacterium C7867-006]
MFIKTVISFILAHLMFLGGTNTKVYVAPEEPISIQATTTNTIAIATSSIIKTIKDTKPTTTETKKTTVKKPAEVQKTTPEVVVQPQIPKAPEPTPDFEAINTFARKATVNILCTTKGGELNPISGTGAIVEPNGLILTNAHVAQYLLLKDYREKDFIQCVARTGSPAYPTYNLELVYISPTWVANNKTELKEQNPKGTGEDDFAFLRITKMIDNSNLPEQLPFITMNVRENIEINEPVILVSYPAGFLGGLSILQNLNITSSITNIQDVYTFKDGTIDIISVGGTIVSQKGSSGGLVVDKKATLIGVISTSSDGDTTSQRGLNAITLAYINRDLQRELKINFAQFLSQDPGDFAKMFASTTAPELTKLITDELNK